MSEQNHMLELTPHQVEQVYHANAKVEIERLRAELVEVKEAREALWDKIDHLLGSMADVMADRAALVEALKNAKEAIIRYVDTDDLTADEMEQYEGDHAEIDEAIAKHGGQS